jgi:hypothetical protein
VKRSLLPIALLAILLAPEVLLVGRAVRQWNVQRDFAAYYLAAVRLNNGESAYGRSALETASFGRRPPQTERYLYPPALAIGLRPVARLNYDTAAGLWLVLSVAAIVGAVVMLGRLVGLRQTQAAALAALAVFLPPSEITLSLGQVNSIVLLLTAGACLALTGQSRRGDVSAGALIAAAAAIKVYPGALALLLVRPYRRVAAASLIVSLGVYVIVMSWGAGPGAMSEWVREMGGVGGASAEAPNDQSVHAVVGRLTTAHTVAARVFGGGPDRLITVRAVMPRPWLGRRVAWLISFLVLVVTVGAVVWGRRSASRRATIMHRAGALIAATCIALPISWDHYQIALVIPSLFLWRVAKRSSGMRGVLASVWAAIALHRYWRLLVLAGSPWLLAFGFCGTMVMWAVLVRRLIRRRPSRRIAARVAAPSGA